MKRIFIAVSLAAAAVAAQDPSDGEIAKRDAAKWGGGMALYGRSADEAAFMRERVAFLSDSIRRTVAEDALRKPSAEATLKILSLSLNDSSSLVRDPEAGRAFGNKSGPDEDRGIAALNGLKKVLKRIDGNSRFNFQGVVALMLANDMVKTTHRMDASVHQIEVARTTRTFRAFDAAYDEFMKCLGVIGSNKTKGISADEVLMASKLDKYSRGDFTPKASIDRTARVTDGLLASLDEESVKKVAATLNDMDAMFGKAKAAVLADSGFFNKNSMDLCPQDRTLVAGLVANFVMLVDEVQKFLDDNRKLLEKIEDKSSETGRLRTLNEDVSPNYALFAKRGPGKDGHQEYARRVAEALADCRKRYLEISKRVNKPGWMGK